MSVIAFASQRAGGQDLATHLLNEHDNDYMEVVDLRGSIAQELHGAFAEWEVHAQTLTKCKNYLYSLSANPDPAQGPLTREQYVDYFGRVEAKLGLQAQPRALVCHIKNGREHFHAVYSRIDAIREKAVHLAFDKDKLMMVSREFARDHEFTLPAGYFKDKNAPSGKQLSLYEKNQQDTTGLSKEQRIEKLTELWRYSDNAKAFVAALGENGYILATGRKPYVLIDIYGHMNSLPKLIDDRQVKTEHIKAFLENDFPVELLPTVEEARALTAEHRKTWKAHQKSNHQNEQLDQLKHCQAKRREKLEGEFTKLKNKHKRTRTTLQDQHTSLRRSRRDGYIQEKKQLQDDRYRHRPKGLAAFLAKVSGMALLQKKVRHYQDTQRLKVYQNQKAALQLEQQVEFQELERQQDMQSLDMVRQQHALVQVDKRELKSFKTSLLKEQSIQYRRGFEHMPSLTLTLTPPGRMAAPYKAKNRYTSQSNKELKNQFSPKMTKKDKITLSDNFKHTVGRGYSEQQSNTEKFAYKKAHSNRKYSWEKPSHLNKKGRKR